MSLTGTPLLVVVVVLVGLAPLLVVRRWWVTARRGRPNGAAAGVGRALALMGCQLTAMVLTFLVANNSYGFYTSWTDLTGVGTDKPPAVSTFGLVTKGEGRTEKLVVRGGPSGASADALVWLPPQYDDKRFADTKFPVLVVLPGQPSQVQTMFKHFDFGAVASREIAGGRVKPFIAVFPPLMIDPPRDTECTDVDAGPHALTWLQKDVPDAVLTKYRVTSAVSRWSVTGWSTGGFCAAKLLLTEPGRFTAAASLGGYFEPLTDNTTGKLFRTPAERNANSPLHLYDKSGLAPGRSLLIVTGEQDDESWPMSQRMITATKGDGQVYTDVFTEGGHNYRNYKDLLPGVLDWFQSRGVFG